MDDQNGVFAEAHKLEAKGEAFALALIIESKGSTPRNTGRMIIRLNGSTVGTVGGGPMEARVIEEAGQALAEEKSRTVHRRLTPLGKDAAGMECGGTMTVHIDVSPTPNRLLLIGGGHVNLAIAKAGAALGFAVDIAESRREFCTAERFPMARALFLNDKITEALTAAAPDDKTFVVIATHNEDVSVLKILINSPAAYLGMLGSKRKVAVAIETLRKAGIPEARISQLRAPIGLDIGAETPEEIAVSVMAEILTVKTGRGGLPLQGLSIDLVVIRGGGDLATGTAWRLRRSGFPVVILEVPEPTVIRRTVAFAQALDSGEVTVEGITARHAENLAHVYAILAESDIPVLADPDAKSLSALQPGVVIDAILAKRNLGTRRDMAPIVIALGPGFKAGKDSHAVVETARGHSLGRVILQGTAEANTGTPGIIAGKGAERVLRSPAEGLFEASVDIGDLVKEGQVIAQVDGKNITAPFDGKVRGLLSNGLKVNKNFKVGDVDPRGADVDENLISDKARAVAGGVLEALLLLRHKTMTK